MGRTKDALKATGATTLLLIAPTVEALDECRRLQSTICGIQSPILPHGQDGDPMAPPPFRQLMNGTNTGTGTDTSSSPPPQDVPHVFWAQEDEEWNFAVHENLRIQRNHIASLIRPFVATGTQTSDSGCD
jgi:hypothetical protein